MDITLENLEHNLGRIGDPPAGALVAGLARDGRLSEINRLLRGLTTSAQEIPPGLPEELRAFLVEARKRPVWANDERLIRVHGFFQDDGVHIGTVLALGSMAMAYAVPLGAKMMSMTHRPRYPQKRMANTAQFVFDLMRPNPFAPDGPFVMSAIKVRLIHATIRHHLRESGQWNEDSDGVPASQEHLLIVWLALSVKVLDFLERMRISVTPQQAEDYLHTWRVAGGYLGLRAESMPPTAGEARQLSDTVLARVAGPSKEGAELTRALLDMYKGVIPGRIFDGIVPALLRHLIGKDIADMLEVPNSRFWGLVVRSYVSMLGLLEKIENRYPVAERLLDRMFGVLCRFELRLLTRGHTVGLDLPTDLAGYQELQEQTPTDVVLPEQRPGHIPAPAILEQPVTRSGSDEATTRV